MNIGIYGAGGYGEIFYNSMLENKIKIDFFIDEYTTQKTLHNIPIYRIVNSPKAKIFNSVASNENKVIKELNKSNKYVIINFEDTLKEFPNIISNFAKKKYLWLRDDIPLLDKELNIVRSFFLEEKSLLIFDKIVSFRKDFNMNNYPSPNALLSEQYFCKDIKIIDNLPDVRFVDCGAYNGDTIEKLFAQYGEKVSLSISFEFDPNNLLKLNEKMKKLSERYPSSRLLSYPTGVFSKNKYAKISINDSSTMINNEGDTNVYLTSLDSTIFGAKPNYIKMDIEGAEYEAIQGASNIISLYKPNLAISIYHKASDLWKIPVLIMQLNPDYEMFLRVHNHLGIETILYCIHKGNTI